MSLLQMKQTAGFRDHKDLFMKKSNQAVFIA